MVKIDKVILSSTDSPTYLEFWPYIAKAWKKLLGPDAEVILGHLSNIPTPRLDNYGTVLQFPSIEGMLDKNSSKIIRTIIAARYPDSYCLMTDVDMLPLNANYFISNSEFASDNNIVLYSSDQSGHPAKHPICYMLAKGKIFKELINPDNLEENQLLKQWASTPEYIFNAPTFSDETLYKGFFLRWGIMDKNKDRVVRLKRGWTNNIAHERIDRAFWFIDQEKLQRGEYIDAHLLRPLTSNFNRIKPLFDYLGI